MEEPICDCASCRYAFYRNRLKLLHAETTFTELRAKAAAEDVLKDAEVAKGKEDARKFLEEHKHLERT